MFYTVAYHSETRANDVNMDVTASCAMAHSKFYDDKMIPIKTTAIFINEILGTARTVPFILLTINDNAIDYSSSCVVYADIIETLTNGNVYDSTTYKLTLYYRER